MHDVPFVLLDGGDHRGRTIAKVVAQLHQDVDTADIGQHPVEQVEIEGIPARRTQELAAAVKNHDGMFGVLEPKVNQFSLIGIVLKQRDAQSTLPAKAICWWHFRLDGFHVVM